MPHTSPGGFTCTCRRRTHEASVTRHPSLDPHFASRVFEVAFPSSFDVARQPDSNILGIKFPIATQRPAIPPFSHIQTSKTPKRLLIHHSPWPPVVAEDPTPTSSRTLIVMPSHPTPSTVQDPLNIHALPRHTLHLPSQRLHHPVQILHHTLQPPQKHLDLLLLGGQRLSQRRVL